MRGRMPCGAIVRQSCSQSQEKNSEDKSDSKERRLLEVSRIGFCLEHVGRQTNQQLLWTGNRCYELSELLKPGTNVTFKGKGRKELNLKIQDYQGVRGGWNETECKKEALWRSSEMGRP